jgi:cell wall-associated NlpC family hydrolase
MAAHLRLSLIVLALVYSAVFGPGAALGNASTAHTLPRKGQWLRVYRSREQRLRPSVPLGSRAVRFARSLVGVPYRWGGDSPTSGFDCSGFVRFVYAHFGLNLPHSSYADFDLGVRISRHGLRPGDLVFFDGVGHVGMYVGGGRFIHAPHSGTSVQVTSLSDPWYVASYDGARRMVVHQARRLQRHSSANGWRTMRSHLRLF